MHMHPEPARLERLPGCVAFRQRKRNGRPPGPPGTEHQHDGRTDISLGDLAHNARVERPSDPPDTAGVALRQPECDEFPTLDVDGRDWPGGKWTIGVESARATAEAPPSVTIETRTMTARFMTGSFHVENGYSLLLPRKDVSSSAQLR